MGYSVASCYEWKLGAGACAHVFVLGIHRQAQPAEGASEHTCLPGLKVFHHH